MDTDQGPVTDPVEHLRAANRLLASAAVRGTTGMSSWDAERLAAAQVHALVAIGETLIAVTEALLYPRVTSTGEGNPDAQPPSDPD